MSSHQLDSSAERSLSAGAVAMMLMLCLSWGFNQIAVKLVLPDVPPMLQATIRSAGAQPSLGLELHEPVEHAEIFFDTVDRVLVMGTEIGIKGVGLDPATPGRVSALVSSRAGRRGDRGRDSGDYSQRDCGGFSESCPAQGSAYCRFTGRHFSGEGDCCAAEDDE